MAAPEIDDEWGSPVVSRTDELPAILLARAAEAQQHAELLQDLAREATIQALITQMRADTVMLSPVVEARLALMLGRGAAGARTR